MNELIITVIITVISMLVGVIYYGIRRYGPGIVNWVRSFIKWHRTTDLED